MLQDKKRELVDDQKCGRGNAYPDPQRQRIRKMTAK